MIKKMQLPKVDFSNIEWPNFDISGIQWLKMPKLKIGNLVSKLPIIQGGMGVGISLSGLASAVANEGGIGVIAANSIGMLDPRYYAKNKDANAKALRNEIKKTKEKTAGIIGVNIMVAVHDFHELLNVCIEEKVDIVFLGAGLPIKGIPIEALRKANVKVVPIVSSARATKLIFKSWVKRYKDIPDAVVVEGPKAGGHLGFKKEHIEDPTYKLESLVPLVISEIKTFEETFSRQIPVIAAGGIYTGDDIFKFFKLGVKGIQMGTRFVATHECDADIKFKEAYISCKKEDIVIIKSPVGLPGRAIENTFLKNIAQGKRKKIKCAWRCLQSCEIKTAPYCISLALDNARKGILDQGFAFAGSNAFRVNKITSVKELIQELKKQYLSAEVKGTSRLRIEYDKALERLVSLKEEYKKTLKESFNSIKDEYEKSIEKGVATFSEENKKIMEEINSLKAEYYEMLDKANCLKEELLKLLDRYSSFNRIRTD